MECSITNLMIFKKVDEHLDSLCSDRTIHNLDRADFAEAKAFADEVNRIKSNYEFVVVDTPPGLGRALLLPFSRRIKSYARLKLRSCLSTAS